MLRGKEGDGAWKRASSSVEQAHCPVRSRSAQQLGVHAPLKPNMQVWAYWVQGMEDVWTLPSRKSTEYSVFGGVGADENFLSVGNAGADESSGGDVEGVERRQALMGGTT